MQHNNEITWGVVWWIAAFTVGALAIWKWGVPSSAIVLVLVVWVIIEHLRKVNK